MLLFEKRAVFLKDPFANMMQLLEYQVLTGKQLLPAPSNGWCLNPKCFEMAPFPIHLAPRKEGPGILYHYLNEYNYLGHVQQLFGSCSHVFLMFSVFNLVCLYFF